MCYRTAFTSLLLLTAAIAVGRAQEPPLNPPAPFVAGPATAVSPGDAAVTAAAAERAQEMGFPSAAAALYRGLLAIAGGDHRRWTLGLATALLDEGQAEEAQTALNGQTGERGAAWHLRAALAAAQLKQDARAKTELADVKADELAPGDRAWLAFLQGTLADSAGDLAKANTFYQQAAAAAVNDLARARFVLAQERARLRIGPVTEEAANAARKNLEQYQGRGTGYDFARTYAVMLDALGRKGEAVAVLQHTLLTLPTEERERADDFQLLLGLIAGARDGAGRNALSRLLAGGHDRDKQRIALQLLAGASQEGAARTDFRRQLDELIGAPQPHPILEDLLLYRAQVELADKSYAPAEDDARALLQKFPGSPLKAHALGVLTGSAWEQHRYRTAADSAAKARAELPPGPERAQLGVLVAEAWFRAHDYRSAADAYAATLRDPPEGVAPGVLMFQRVDAEIAAGSPDQAAAVLDTLARDPRFDAVNRWQAEWNLARALQVQGENAQAYERVTRLLAGADGAALPADLRARMAWLQARLAAEAGKPEETLKLVDALTGSLNGVGAELKSEIASSAGLLRAKANFTLNRDADALAILRKLRADFPRSDAAVASYFDEAGHYAKQDKAVEAQQLLTKVADDFPDHPYAPYALFQAALQAERRGQDDNFREANRLIEDLVKKYPQSGLVFDARLKQGDLLRKLNQFPQAQRAYEALVNQYPQRPDIALAQLALAETHNAQSASDPSHIESALVLFEHVRDRVDAPLDARVEAGYNLGRLLARRDEPAKAETVWWRDVVSAFLLDADFAPKLGEKGRYWMARTLIELGALYEGQEKLEQAKQAWLLILKTRLPGEALARARLARFGLAEAKP
jgi:TolA-binding protein